MDFRLKKFRLVLWILAVGLVVSLLYHGWQGWGRGKEYPFNTFLCFPQGRYDDFTNYIRFTIAADPYKGPPGICNNFPASYLLLYPFSSLPPTIAAVLFLDLCVVGLYLLLQYALQKAIPHPGWRMVACVLFLWSYPVLFCLDRGNNDILLVLLVALSLLFYSQQKFTLSFLCLLLPVCVKFYPGILLILFIRRRLFHWAVAGLFSFVFVSWLALLSFHSTVDESYHAFLSQLSTYNRNYNMEWAGVSASASAWNPFRAMVWLYYSNENDGPQHVGGLPLTVTHPALIFYGVICLVGLLLLVFYVLVVETSFARRAILLLLFMTVSSPGGGDYKMMYTGVALILLLLIRERRFGDMWVSVLLAFCLLPKREVILDFMGKSDTGYADASLGVILNPVCMLAAMLLLMWSGWLAAQPVRLGPRCRKLLGVFSFAGLRFRRNRLRPA